jgi:hypothetical protein
MNEIGSFRVSAFGGEIKDMNKEKELYART